jgi:indole-3-acetate monooxygenase
MRTLLRLGATNAAKVGAEVARAAYTMTGTTGIFTGHPLADALQDAMIVPQHAFLADGTWQSAGRMLLRMEPAPGFP